MKFIVRTYTIFFIIFSFQIHASQKNQTTVSPTEPTKKLASPSIFTFKASSNASPSLVRTASALQQIQACRAQNIIQSNNASTQASKLINNDVKKRDSSPDSSPEPSPEEKKQKPTTIKPRTRHSRTVSLATAQQVAKEVIKKRENEGKRTRVSPEPSPTATKSKTSKHKLSHSGDYTHLNGELSAETLKQKALKALQQKKLQPPPITDRTRPSIYHSSPTPTPSAIQHADPHSPSQYGSYLGAVPQAPHNRKPRIKNSISKHMNTPQDTVGEEAGIETVAESGSEDEDETEYEC